MVKKNQSHYFPATPCTALAGETITREKYETQLNAQKFLLHE